MRWWGWIGFTIVIFYGGYPETANYVLQDALSWKLLAWMLWWAAWQ